MARSSAGVLPPVDTWHPQVWAWMHGAWLEAGGLDGGPLGLAQLVRALWSAGDPWSRAYRDLFAGAPAPTRRLGLSLPEDEVFYSGEPDLVEVMEAASRLGAGRIHPWAILTLVAERTRGSAEAGRPGWEGVRRAPVDAVGEATTLRVHREASVEEVMDWAGGRQVVAMIVSDRVSSGAQRFATPYVEGHFHLLGDDRWVLREPASKAPFWVLEGVSPDAMETFAEVLVEVRRRVPGFIPWLPLKSTLSAEVADRLVQQLSPCRTLARVILTTEPGPRPDEAADPLVVALDRLTGGDEETRITPILADHPHREDLLGHTRLATGLVTSLRAPATELPVTLAILGPSGSGRTDLLRRLAEGWERHDGRVLHLKAHEPLLHAVVDALAGPVPPANPDPEPPPTPDPTPIHKALGIVLPGAYSEAPAGARTLARLGLGMICVGAPCTLASLGHWLALAPASILGLGAICMATGVGRGLLQEPEPQPIPAPAPPTPTVSERLASAPKQAPLLLAIDELDRVPTEVAAARLQELAELLQRPDLPPIAVALGCDPQTLLAACPDTHPVRTLIDVPLWLPPIRYRQARTALAAWTGLSIPSRPAPPPKLRAVRGREDGPPPAVPIRVDADQTHEIGPADLAALMRVSDLIPPSPRAWKALVNRVRLCRPHLPVGVGAPSLLTWLAMAAADPDWAQRAHGALTEESDVATVLLATSPPELRPAIQDVPPLFWPDARALLDAAEPCLRWTFSGPYGPVPIAARSADRAAS